MYPKIKPGESVPVYLFQSPKEIAHFKPGDLLLHRDDHELMIHRLHENGRLKGDWSPHYWDGPIYGVVLAKEHPSITRLYLRFSHLTAHSNKLMRRTGRVGLLLINVVDRIASRWEKSPQK